MTEIPSHELREIVGAAVAIALLGSRVTERFEPHYRLPMPVSPSISEPGMLSRRELEDGQRPSRNARSVTCL
jgi:hypothetical protein